MHTNIVIIIIIDNNNNNNNNNKYMPVNAACNFVSIAIYVCMYFHHFFVFDIVL